MDLNFHLIQVMNINLIKNKMAVVDQIYRKFLVVGETYGFAMTLIGLCTRKQRSHAFRVDTDKIDAAVRKDFHPLTCGKLLLLNYRFAATVQ